MTRDLAILDDGREVPIADFGYGELLVLCMRGRIRCIRPARDAAATLQRELIACRSPETVRRMEQERGLR